MDYEENTMDNYPDSRKMNGLDSSHNNNEVQNESSSERTEDDDTMNEESSPPDYEYVLRVENIRLKSKLEQLKEQTSSLEKEIEKKNGEVEHEKLMVKKANKTIYSLMQDKQKLEDELKRRNTSMHPEGIEELVGKLENEVLLLEERLDRQRKRYNNEHMMMYDEMRHERRRQEDWKQMYFKSQVAVMSFRRRIDKIKPKIGEKEYHGLVKCLEMFEDDHIRKDIGILSSGSRNLQTKENNEIKKERDQFIAHRKELNSKKVDNPDTERAPKVFIMDEENALVETEPTTDIKFSPKPKVDFQNYNKESTMKPRQQAYQNNTYRNYQSFSSNDPRSSRDNRRDNRYERQESTQHVKQYWHNYSTDNPPRKNTHEKPDVKLVKPTSYYNISVKEPNSDILKADAKFLELKFDNSFLKHEVDSIQTSYKNKMPISKAPYSFHKYQGPIDEINRSNHHIAAGTPLENKKLWCLKCEGDVTKNPCGHTSDLVIQEREKEFPCPTCKKIFNNRSHLKRHNMIHSGEKPYACTYCDKRFNRKSHLNRHLLTHTGEKPFKCPTCGKGFADNSDLKRHKQIHQISPALSAISPKVPNIMQTQSLPSSIAPSSIVNVTVSGIVTSTIPNVASSQNAVIAISAVSTPSGSTILNYEDQRKRNEFRYPCDVCGKLFTRRSHMTRHRLTHDQEKIYCDCGRMFRQNSHLQAHLPSCKRKRDAIEARYRAKHGLKNDIHAQSFHEKRYIYNPNTKMNQEISSQNGGKEFSPNRNIKKEEILDIRKEGEIDIVLEKQSESSIIHDDPSEQVNERLEEPLESFAEHGQPSSFNKKVQRHNTNIETNSSILKGTNLNEIVSGIHRSKAFKKNKDEESVGAVKEEKLIKISKKDYENDEQDLNFNLSTLPALPPLIKDPVS